jgi:hypothetical protein
MPQALPQSLQMLRAGEGVVEQHRGGRRGRGHGVLGLAHHLIAWR